MFRGAQGAQQTAKLIGLRGRPCQKKAFYTVSRFKIEGKKKIWGKKSQKTQVHGIIRNHLYKNLAAADTKQSKTKRRSKYSRQRNSPVVLGQSFLQRDCWN